MSFKFSLVLAAEAGSAQATPMNSTRTISTGGAPNFDRSVTHEPQSTRDLLESVLKMPMQSISHNNIPFNANLRNAIESFIDLMDRIELRSANTQCLLELAGQLGHLMNTVTELAIGKPDMARMLVQRLDGEVRFLTKDISEAHGRGQLEEFFNGTGGASSLAQHNIAVAQMTADSWLARHEIARSSPTGVPPQGQNWQCYVTGGTGGRGGSGNIGGAGGDGDGPELGMGAEAHMRISGGIGGTGGVGIAVSGKDGTGKAPVIRSHPNPTHQPGRT
ncbi:hypothetical protein C8J57DRAFT_1473670 [Mycena rebaudengoi]|nr:hypothetical protein C8J57DRAFT_1473670 [Mycena rebaudengoi]